MARRAAIFSNLPEAIKVFNALSGHMRVSASSITITLLGGPLVRPLFAPTLMMKGLCLYAYMSAQDSSHKFIISAITDKDMERDMVCLVPLMLNDNSVLEYHIQYDYRMLDFPFLQHFNDESSSKVFFNRTFERQGHAIIGLNIMDDIELRDYDPPPLTSDTKNGWYSASFSIKPGEDDITMTVTDLAQLSREKQEIIKAAELDLNRSMITLNNLGDSIKNWIASLAPSKDDVPKIISKDKK